MLAPSIRPNGQDTRRGSENGILTRRAADNAASTVSPEVALVADTNKSFWANVRVANRAFNMTYQVSMCKVVIRLKLRTIYHRTSHRGVQWLRDSAD